MNTDLKARAEALLAALKVDGFKYIAGRPLDDLPWLKEAIAAFMEAADAATVLALIRERDEARAERDDLAQSLKQIMVADREAAEASLASYKEEVERLRGALGTIADLHIPDQPAHFGGDELEWAQRHVGTLRRLAIETLTKEPPHAG